MLQSRRVSTPPSTIKYKLNMRWPPCAHRLSCLIPVLQRNWANLPLQVALPSPKELPGTESPDPPPLSRHYMKASMKACSRCHEGGKCPGQGLCPVLGVVPVESMVLLVQEPRLKVSKAEPLLLFLLLPLLLLLLLLLPDIRVVQLATQLALIVHCC